MTKAEFEAENAKLAARIRGASREVERKSMGQYDKNIADLDAPQMTHSVVAARQLGYEVEIREQNGVLYVYGVKRVPA